MSWWKFWQRKPKAKRVELPVSKKPVGDLARPSSRYFSTNNETHDSRTCLHCRRLAERDSTSVPIIVPMESSGLGFGPTPIFVPPTPSWSVPTPDPVKGIQEASDALDSTLNRASDTLDTGLGSPWSGGGSGDYEHSSGGSSGGGGSFDRGSYSSDGGSSSYHSGSSSSSYDSGSSYSSSSDSSSSSSSSSSDSGSSSSGGGGGE